MLEVVSPREIAGSELRESRSFSIDRSFDETVAAYGLTTSIAVPSIIVPPREQVVLSNIATPVLRKTADIAEFKEWIGMSNALIEQEPLDGLPALPKNAWPSGRVIASLDGLSAAEVADVEAAANAYIWGDSRLVRSYKETLDRVYGPFEVDVYVVSKLVVDAGATLLVSGRPTAILCESIELHDGSSLRLHAVTRMWVQSLRKLSIVH